MDHADPSVASGADEVRPRKGLTEHLRANLECLLRRAAAAGWRVSADGPMRLGVNVAVLVPRTLRDLALIGIFGPSKEGEVLGERANHRVRLSYPARVVVVDEHAQVVELTARLVNLSERGAALRVQGRLIPATVARLVVDVPGTPIDCSVHVIWTGKNPRWQLVGVTFAQLAPAQESTIAQLLADASN